MGASYWTAVADKIADGIEWPPGLRPAGEGARITEDSRWLLVRDDTAPAELEGRLVSLVFTRHADETVTWQRRLLGDVPGSAVHAR